MLQDSGFQVSSKFKLALIYLYVDYGKHEFIMVPTAAQVYMVIPVGRCDDLLSFNTYNYVIYAIIIYVYNKDDSSFHSSYFDY